VLGRECARSHTDTHSHSHAVVCFTVASALQMPSAAVKAFNAAVAHREAGDLSTSAQAYQSAIAMEPRMAEAYLNVAFVLSELRRFDEAEHAYRHALGVRKWPAQTAATASHNLGVLLDSLGRSSEATAAYKQALKYKPDFGPSLEILEDTTANAIEAGEPPTFVALINAGNEAFERGAHSEAEQHCPDSQCRYEMRAGKERHMLGLAPRYTAAAGCRKRSTC